MSLCIQGDSKGLYCLLKGVLMADRVVVWSVKEMVDDNVMYRNRKLINGVTTREFYVLFIESIWVFVCKVWQFMLK